VDGNRKITDYNALRDSEERLQLAVDISRISTFDIDLKTDHVETDDTGRAIYGFEPDEPLTFTKVQSHFHPEDRDEVGRRVSAAFAPEGSDEFEVEQRIIRADGEVRWIRVRGRLSLKRRTPTAASSRALSRNLRGYYEQ
jgi:PAS domain S-box-containing protein